MARFRFSDHRTSGFFQVVSRPMLRRETCSTACSAATGREEGCDLTDWDGRGGPAVSEAYDCSSNFVRCVDEEGRLTMHGQQTETIPG